MSYEIDYHDLVFNDFKDLDKGVRVKVLKKIEKIAQNPEIGKELGNKANLNLSKCRKAYVDNKRIRIVYQIIDKQVKIFVIAIGKRDDMEVYKKANDRI